MKHVYMVDGSLVSYDEFHSERKRLIGVYGTCPVQTFEKDECRHFRISEENVIQHLAVHLGVKL